jgi:hypothetical protein
VEELGEAWPQRRRTRVVLMAVLVRGGEGRVDDAVPGRGGEGRVDGVVPGCSDVEEEREAGVEEEQGADVEAHAEEGARWRARGGGGREGHDDIINIYRYI